MLDDSEIGSSIVGHVVSTPELATDISLIGVIIQRARPFVPRWRIFAIEWID